jgi:hypothetical protein
VKKIFRTPVPALLVFAASLMLVLAGTAPATAAKFKVTATVQADGAAGRGRRQLGEAPLRQAAAAIGQSEGGG